MREILVGDKLDQYQLTDLLAKSGMASIFKAIDTETGQTVALKVPYLQLESDVVFFERFKREEKIGLRLQHPNIVKVLEPREKTRMYLALEFVDGKSLRAVMNEQKQMPLARALRIAKQIGGAMQYLHEQGVVHRDLKPENVLLVGDDDQVKILDFGIALDESARRLTWFKLSTAMGTPDYMAPEQIGGRRGDARTDIYALATILFEMFTGHLPYSASNPHTLVRAKTSEDPRPLSYFLPNVEPNLEAVVMKALERAPRDRYETMTQFLADLADPVGAAERAPGERARSNRRKLRVSRRWITSVTVVAVLAVLGTLVWLSSRQPVGIAPPPAAPSTGGRK